MDKSVLASTAPQLAKAKVGIPSARVRSDFGKSVVNAAYAALPAAGFGGQSLVKAAMVDKVLVDAGAEATLGRLAMAYPKKGFVPRRPVTEGEARQALKNCGLDFSGVPAHAMRPFPLNPRSEGEVGVKINPKSGNGFPVLAKANTPGAVQRCMALAVGVRQELEKLPPTPQAFAGWLRAAEEERPHLVALLGKAKGDYYSVAKVVDAKLRFYNEFPRQMVLNMQIATQVVELNARSILREGHSGMGVSLEHGGAAELVEALEAQLRQHGHAYVHVGDDSWVAVRDGSRIVVFALDCSNFDLTQHGRVTKAIHDALYEELRRVDIVAAGLWHAYARERMVVTTGTLVYRWKHGGPSGMPLQSKVNDMLMDVMIQRTLASLVDGAEASVASAVEKAGQDMGFSVRLEQYGSFRADTLKEVLEQRPFLFVGKYFHVRGGGVRVCADIQRTLAQTPYPTLKWAATGKELRITEAMRLGSIALGLGMPPADLQDAVDAFRAAAREHVVRALELDGDVKDERLRWAVSADPFGPAPEASLSGLLRALDRDPAILWLEKEKELPGTSTLVFGWADMVEEDERAEAREAGVSGERPGALPLPRPLRVAGRPPPTHPVTAANLGRPPPTARWGPNKVPQAYEPRAGGRRRRVYGSDTEWPEESVDHWSDSNQEEVDGDFHDFDFDPDFD